MLRAAEKLRISEMEVSRTTKMPLVCYFLRSVQAHEVATQTGCKHNESYQGKHDRDLQL
jgi:hypothetical protein